ncbi:MAG TPA: PLP-dependent aspartate aminotransferase family protein [Nitrososphaerales archaeon]|nr:PLP-dependent aspartate aminotransferase family protein [Nitrososphaerales archaeon]
MKFGTRAVHAGEEPDISKSGDVVSPIHLSSTFARRLLEKPTRGLEYSRTGNPTRTALERRLASLEGAKHALAFSSGMAAEATLLLSVLKKGDRVVAGDDLYGGTVRIFETTFRKFGVSFAYVDTRNLKTVRSALERRPAIAWLESPTNPLMHVCDIRSIAQAASRVGAITVVDNTFASPFLQNPLSLGADVVVHSTTKYIGGHSDVVGGALMMSDDELFESVKFNQNAIGAVPSPFDCFLVLRGSKTLHLRMQRHSENAQKVAEFLSHHPKFSAVHYPGLKSHAQFALAKRQMKMPGGMLSAEMKGGMPEVRRFLKELRVFALAESLGGVESLVDHPATMTHASLSAERRKGLGIGDGLVRFSVGIEDPEDLIGDLKGALS